ncbi:MAG TPA: nickel-binding protein [Acidimicrobiales bacterium]|jgi:hypothetical protein|nr:nickel-binding protein [Acidimicrobiales bacterium]
MDLYAIFRRSGWAPNELGDADARSNEELEKRTEHVRKIRSYVLEEPDGRVGAICLYLAENREAIFEHARSAGLPVDEVVKVLAIDVKRPDPELERT